ncbi:MAG: zinc-binding dehydrogenase [Pseudomonadota bacterium]
MAYPETMMAALLVEQRAPLVIDEVAIPQNLAVGQVLVKVHYSGICGSQLGEIDGVKGPDRFLPHLLGHEGSGTVISTGEGVRHVCEGDRVVLHWRKGPGIECILPKYQWGEHIVNAGWVTTFNEYAIVSENRLTVIPNDFDLQVAALFGCAVTTGFGVVVNNAKLTIGESVVIFGAGGVGLNMVQAAAMVSAYPVIAVDLHDNRLALAEEMGATHTLNAKNVDAFAEIEKILEQQNLDVFIDNTGKPDIIAQAYEMTSAQGRVILVGVPRAGEKTTLYTLPLHFGKCLTGSHGGEAKPESDIPRYGSMFQKGRLKLNELISQVYQLSDINDAIDDMRSGKLSGRCMIEMK